MVKIARRVAKANQDITGGYYIKNDDGVVAVTNQSVSKPLTSFHGRGIVCLL